MRVNLWCGECGGRQDGAVEHRYTGAGVGPTQQYRACGVSRRSSNRALIPTRSTAIRDTRATATASNTSGGSAPWGKQRGQTAQGRLICGESPLDVLLDMQHDAITRTDDVVEQLRRTAKGQLRFLVEHRDEALIAIGEFLWAGGDALTAILERRRRYRAAFEDLLNEGVSQRRTAVANPKIAAFSITEMAEGVPRWFRPGGDMSINQLAYLCGEFALRIAGV